MNHVNLESLKKTEEKFKKDPAVSEVNFKVNVETDASAEQIGEVERLARERCPAVFCLTQPIELNIKIINH
ncbi:MAG: hypothetical protein V3U20_04625 [Thermoplasmata archaeon]